MPGIFKHNKIVFLSVSFLILLFGIFIIVWLFYNPVNNFEEQVPGLDKRGVPAEILKTEEVKIGDKFRRYAEFQPGLQGKWQQFRGANSDNILKTDIPLNENWDEKPPAIVWVSEMGEGHAAPAVYNGLVYILDYDEKEKSDALRCFSLADGKELWRRWYKVKVKRNHGRSRTIPAVNENYIVTIGPRCHVMCLERVTGNLLWSIDLEMQYQVETPFWYTGQCPRIDNDIAVIAPGGKSLLIAVDCKTGKVLWEAPNAKKWKMSHASVTLATICNKKMYIYPAIGGISGISAEGDDTGSILWEYDVWTPSVIAPTALQVGTDKILFTAGYGAGSIVLKIEKSVDRYSATKSQRYRPEEGIASEQQTPVLFNGFVYGIQPKDAGVLKNQMVCYNPSDFGRPVWSSGKTNRFGLGPYMIINDKFLILNDDGTLTLASAYAGNYKQLSRKKFFEGEDSWGPMAFADGYLLLRDSKKLYCIDLRK